MRAMSLVKVTELAGVSAAAASIPTVKVANSDRITSPPCTILVLETGSILQVRNQAGNHGFCWRRASGLRPLTHPSLGLSAQKTGSSVSSSAGAEGELYASRVVREHFDRSPQLLGKHSNQTEAERSCGPPVEAGG